MLLVHSIFFSAATKHLTVLVTHIVGTNNAVTWFHHLAPAADPDSTPVSLLASTLWQTI